jgi:hypothetical protein
VTVLRALCVAAAVIDGLLARRALRA